jgi:signal transduction histidine kinase
LIEFVDGATDAQLLVKIVDVTEFIKRSFDRLEEMARSNVTIRKKIFISNKLKPFVVDTSQSLKLVNVLELHPPSTDLFNPLEMRFLKDE